MSDTTKPEQEDASDEQVAALIRQSVEVLNVLLSKAAKRGLDVEITSHDVSAMGEYPRSRSVYNVRVARRTEL